MRLHSTVLRGMCACLLGTAQLAHAQSQPPIQPAIQPAAQSATQPAFQRSTQTNNDAAVDPAAARQQAREIAQGDPARWYREDTSPQARLRTRQKEIGAALQEARNTCKKAPAAERNACMQEARATYQRDLAAAKAQVEGQVQTP